HVVAPRTGVRSQDQLGRPGVDRRGDSRPVPPRGPARAILFGAADFRGGLEPARARARGDGKDRRGDRTGKDPRRASYARAPVLREHRRRRLIGLAVREKGPSGVARAALFVACDISPNFVNASTKAIEPKAHNLYYRINTR